MIPYARFTRNRSPIDFASSTDSSSVTDMNRDGIRGRLQIVPRLLPLGSECHVRGIIACTPRKMSTRRSASNVRRHTLAVIRQSRDCSDQHPFAWNRPRSSSSASHYFLAEVRRMNAIVIRYVHVFFLLIYRNESAQLSDKRLRKLQFSNCAEFYASSRR